MIISRSARLTALTTYPLPYPLIHTIISRCARLGAKPTLGKKGVPGAAKGAGANGAISADGRYVKSGAVPANKFSLLGDSPGSGGKSSLLNKKAGGAGGEADETELGADEGAKSDDAVADGPSNFEPDVR